MALLQLLVIRTMAVYYRLGLKNLNDFRYLMSLGALLFKRSDFKAYGDGFNVYCSIFGRQGAFRDGTKYRIIELILNPKAFPDAGIYILRRNDNYLLFNATGKDYILNWNQELIPIVICSHLNSLPMVNLS